MTTKPKHITEVSEVVKADQGVRVQLTSQEQGVEEAVRTMVENCQQGKCDCMKPETKAKITGMEFQTIDGRAAIAIQGNISVADIKEAMERSKVELCCTVDSAKA